MSPEKKVTIVTVVFIVLVVLFGGAAIYWFQFEELAALEKKRDEVNGEVVKMREKQRKLPELKQKEQELPEIAARLERKVPTLPGGTWDPHRQHFYMLRKKCGVSLKRDSDIPLRLAAGKAAGGPGRAEEATFELQIEGGFAQIGRLIHMLEHAEPIMVVESFGIKGRRSSTGVALKEMRIKLRTYGFAAEEK